MDTAVLGALARQLLTLAGGYAATRGWVDADTATGIVGALATLASAGWSIYEKKSR
jgi:hypothetical protein